MGRFGTKRLCLLSIAVFSLGPAPAGLAWWAGSPIAFRVIHGLAAG